MGGIVLVKERNWYSEGECGAPLKMGKRTRKQTTSKTSEEPKSIPTDAFYIDRIPGTFLHGESFRINLR